MIRANMITGSAPEIVILECTATGSGEVTLAEDFTKVCVSGTWVNSTPYSTSSASISVNGTSVGTLDEVEVGGSGNYNTITFAHVLSDLKSGDVITPSGGIGLAATISIFGVK